MAQQPTDDLGGQYRQADTKYELEPTSMTATGRCGEGVMIVCLCHLFTILDNGDRPNRNR